MINKNTIFQEKIYEINSNLLFDFLLKTTNKFDLFIYVIKIIL